MKASKNLFPALLASLTVFTTYAQDFTTNGGVTAVGAHNPDGSIHAFTQLWPENAILWKNGSGSNLRMGSSSDLVGTGFVEMLRITETGSLCIGTINPGSNKLAVEGTIGARRVLVTQTNPFPDYVFKPNYRLLPLDSVEKYIALHQHLPDVPSAGNVQKDGLDLGVNQTILLKKIEELTLYAIQQQHEIDTLKAVIKKLSKK